ncbi:hypothetical protein WHR41_00827 [Cladosporium halotolerans]|uniref:Alpha/beta hydrolase fold-3 domain-containing protein n=1 Tax=Cladosporium halotolerans TaxID=1052096 RepID=A0AB34L035_9PEZI
MTMPNIPHVAGRTSLSPEIKKFLHDNPDLHLGEEGDFHDERRHHREVFGIHSLPQDRVNPIGRVEFTAIRGPHGTISIRVLYPESSRSSGSDAALIHFHGGGYTVGSVDEFENGLRYASFPRTAELRSMQWTIVSRLNSGIQHSSMNTAP